VSDLPKTKVWEQRWDKLLCNSPGVDVDHVAKDMHDELLARIAELEAENAENKTLRATYATESFNLTRKLEQAEAALAERERMLDVEWGRHKLLNLAWKDEAHWLADLRARAEEGGS
jgi:hypothetical protein